MNRTQVSKIWLTNDAIWIELNDGRMAKELFSDYSRLAFASPVQRSNFEISHFGLHWRGLDEDLSFEGFFNK